MARHHGSGTPRGSDSHNFIYLNLNEPNVLQGDLSWIRPGKTFRSGLSQKEALAAVDFAAERGLQYIHLDAGWYGPEMKMESNANPYIRKQRPGHQGHLRLRLHERHRRMALRQPTRPRPTNRPAAASL